MTVIDEALAFAKEINEFIPGELRARTWWERAAKSMASALTVDPTEDSRVRAKAAKYIDENDPFGDVFSANERALLAAPVAAPPLREVSIEHDGFAGDVIGSYVTREGKRGVVVQQHGTRVVHVYGEKWLLPALRSLISNDSKEG